MDILNIIELLFYCLNIFFIIGFFVWRKKYYDKDADYTIREIVFNGEKAELEEKIKALEGRDKVIKIETVNVQPKYLSCKFSVWKEHITDTKVFKNIVIREVSREIAQELSLNPYAYQLFFTEDFRENSETVEVRMRILPFTEAAVWDGKE